MNGYSLPVAVSSVKKNSLRRSEDIPHPIFAQRKRPKKHHRCRWLIPKNIIKQARAALAKIPRVLLQIGLPLSMMPSVNSRQAPCIMWDIEKKHLPNLPLKLGQSGLDCLSTLGKRAAIIS